MTCGSIPQSINSLRAVRLFLLCCVLLPVLFIDILMQRGSWQVFNNICGRSELKGPNSCAICQWFPPGQERGTQHRDDERKQLWERIRLLSACALLGELLLLGPQHCGKESLLWRCWWHSQRIKHKCCDQWGRLLWAAMWRRSKLKPIRQKKESTQFRQGFEVCSDRGGGLDCVNQGKRGPEDLRGRSSGGR